MEKILSFIVPSYNCEKFLDKCIPSFIEESIIKMLDIIIVNDGSTDHTAEIAGTYCEKYPDSIRLISQKNKGHGGALNTGCKAAVGKYLKVIDADDWVETKNLHQFVEYLRTCESDVVLTHYYTRNITTGEIKKWMTYSECFGKSYTLAEIMSDWKSFERSFTLHGITYRTAFYKKYGMQLSEHVFYEDHEFATIPCCYAKTITPLDLFIYHYRIGDVAQSVSDTNQLKRISHTETVLARFMKEYQSLKLLKESAGREYYCMKAQGLLMGYLTTVLLIEKDRPKGRRLAGSMMGKIKQIMPMTYNAAKKQYLIIRLMNHLHMDKQMLEKMLNSGIYYKLKGKRGFE